jgi:hypothetical protein
MIDLQYGSSVGRKEVRYAAGIVPGQHFTFLAQVKSQIFNLAPCDLTFRYKVCPVSIIHDAVHPPPTIPPIPNSPLFYLAIENDAHIEVSAELSYK